LFINLQVAPLELRFRASDSGTFEPVDFPRHADSRFVAGEHGRTKPVTIHIITSRLNRFDASLVLLIDGPSLPGATALIAPLTSLPNIKPAEPSLGQQVVS